MSNDEMGDLFDEWNKGELNSYLIEITATILRKKDDLTGEGHVVDYIMDKTGMKGTGRWAIQEAAEQSVAAPTIASALDTRYISGRKDERVAAEKVLEGPTDKPVVDKSQIIKDLQAALYCSKIVSYAQGLGIIKAASDKMEWNVDLALCAHMWRGGCIIRAGLLKGIQEAVSRDSNLANLMVDPGFAADLNARHMAWRRIVSGSLPANLVQAQRDFFGGHTYERIDREGTFHTLWDDSHKDIGDLSGRTAGEV
jgi:6-phosphogluconate dehydrogenase